MATPTIGPAFTTGEISPNLYGRVDVAREHTSANTMRNMFPSYKGGAYSRPGTRFVGYSKQTDRPTPPRLIPFQFSIDQGLILEFGNFYMRVIQNGAFVTEPPIEISNIAQSDPGVVTAAGGSGSAATPINTAVGASYAAGQTITLAGGSFSSPAVLTISNVTLLSCALLAPGSGAYAPGDFITLAGGVFTTAAIISVQTTRVVTAGIAAAGTGGTPGAATVVGTTGTGTKFQANVTIDGTGAISSVNFISVPGAYLTNPTLLSNEPVTGGGLTGAALNIDMGVNSFIVSGGGAYTTSPSILTQASSTGTGTGASFQSAIYGPNSVTFSNPGVYFSFPPNPVQQASTSGGGTGAQFNVVWTTGSASDLNTGDWVFISGVQGMTQVNGQTYVIVVTGPTTFQLFDVFGNAIDTTLFDVYTGGGLAARIFTLPTIYAEADLEWLKFTQSADTMTLCCVNQLTHVEYPAQDLARFSDVDWVFTPIVPAPSITPPSVLTAAASATGATFYAYEVTAVAKDGTESIASQPAYVDNAVDVAATAGTITLTWSTVPGSIRYVIYKAQPNYSMRPPVGSLFGFAGTAFGNQFTDSNIVADFTQVPPLHADPFARGQISSAAITNQGGLYTTATVIINTATGTDAVIEPVIVNGLILALIVVDSGKNYGPNDTITIIGDGVGGTGTITVGPQSGTYPGTVNYFQQRRVFGFTLNNPNTYFMSQPGSFTNFDTRIPTIDSDAIIGSPWSLQVNGLQWLVLMPAGLAVFTGLSAWLLVGAGSFATNVSPISPSNQLANPLAFSGCSPTLPPIKVNYDILYVTSKGDYYYDLPYQLYALSEPIDLTNFSSHLFDFFTFREHAWAETPFKLLWTVRSDGCLLSLVYLKQQQVMGWSRHDTNGDFLSIASVVEPIIASRELANNPAQNADAVYLAVGRPVPAYIIERLDNRIWPTVEDCWCVDMGFTNTQPAPLAGLQVTTPSGVGIITGVANLIGGQNYSAATIAEVIDDDGEGPGTGAVPVLTIIGGVITAIGFAPGGIGYVRPALAIMDPENSGSGASADLTLDTSSGFVANAPVFSLGDVGNVIRAGYGSAVITSFVNSGIVIGSVLTPIVQTNPDSPNTPLPAKIFKGGAWTMTTPISTLYIPQLSGFVVTGLADGEIIPPTFIGFDGILTLNTPASAIIVGLGFVAQLQSNYLDVGEPTIQGQRKKVAEVTTRIESSGPFQIGANQPDGAAQNPIELAPVWKGMVDAPTHAIPSSGGGPTPLFTGDVRIPVPGGYNTRGQIAVQQTNPLPLQVLDFVPETLAGDKPSQEAPPVRRGQKRAE